MYKLLIPILFVLILFSFMFAREFSSYTSATLTFDTTKATSDTVIIRFNNAYGNLNISALFDSTGTDSDTTGVSDTLQIFYKMLDYDNGTYYSKHDNWFAAEIYNGTIWTTVLNWTDSTKYLVDFSDLFACDACSLYAVIGVGDSLMATLKIEISFMKQEP